jgi:hypothetical protein
MDAAEWPIPDEPTVVFLYNPFLDRTPREVVIVYYNPLSADVIDDFGFLPHTAGAEPAVRLHSRDPGAGDGAP